MTDLDLDIRNYSISDMETFFRLNPTKNIQLVILNYENIK